MLSEEGWYFSDELSAEFNSIIYGSPDAPSGSQRLWTGKDEFLGDCRTALSRADAVTMT
jgi:hypothetical protein